MPFNAVALRRKMKILGLLLSLMILCIFASGQDKPSALQKSKAHLEKGMPAPKIIEVLGLPEKIKPCLDMTIYYYEGVEIHCYNEDFMKGEINSVDVDRLSDINRQTIAWFIYKPKPISGVQSSAQDTIIIAKDAVLYYLCKRSQESMDEGERKYYYSRGGYVYYRDEYTRPVKLSFPPSAMKITLEQVKRYPELMKYRGYNNRNTGKVFRGLPYLLLPTAEFRQQLSVYNEVQREQFPLYF